MVSELGRRVAIEVMGEEKPPSPTKAMRGPICVSSSPGGAWTIVTGGNFLQDWQPQPFSTSLEHALRALDEHFSDADEVKLHMDRVKNSQRIVYVAYASETRGGRTRIHGPAGLGVELAEAICHHLLALKEEE